MHKKGAAAAGLRGQHGERIVFDDDGEGHRVDDVQTDDHIVDAQQEAKAFLDRERAALQVRDVADKERVRQKKREKKVKEREREREAAQSR